MHSRTFSYSLSRSLSLSLSLSHTPGDRYRCGVYHTCNTVKASKASCQKKDCHIYSSSATRAVNMYKYMHLHIYKHTCIRKHICQYIYIDKCLLIVCSSSTTRAFNIYIHVISIHHQQPVLRRCKIYTFKCVKNIYIYVYIYVNIYIYIYIDIEIVCIRV